MTNSVPPGSSGAPTLGSYTSTPGAGPAMYRRSSYASVVSGAAASSGPQPFNPPTRSGAFSHLVNNSAPGQPQHPSISHSRNTSRAADTDGHHNGMSVSWGRGGHLPSYSSQFGYIGNGFGGFGQEGSAPSFFVPSYLQGSRHAERLEEAHKAKIAAQRELRSNHSSNAGSLSTSSSSVNLHKMVPSHRGMTHDIIERAPVFVEEAVAPWPTRWSEVDKFAQLDVQPDGLEVRFSGSSKTHDEAASIRTDHPMPRQCGIYYFEVTVVSKGKEGMIGIGFCGPKVVLNRIPGWEPESWAYHGDDGSSFCNQTSGKQYGPKFSTMDVIGCGVNFRTGCAFFTKNGVNIGTAFRDIKQDRLYPVVGMKKPGETLRANFGQTPFVFDIDSMVEREKDIIQAEINKTSGTLFELNHKPPQDETAFIHELIAQYLAHDGYVETARAFAEEVREESKSLANGSEAGLKYLDPEEDSDAINRQKIRAAILEGDVDKALKHTTDFYPSVLRNNEHIYFKLRCRKFIEMIRQYNELKHSKSSRSTATNGHHNNTDYDDVFDHQMELDDQINTHNGAWGVDNMDTEDDSRDLNERVEDLLNDTIRYGQELKSEFSRDLRREDKKALEDTFALIAYPDARESSLAPLLEVSGRVPVAEELNSAILVSLGKSSSAALERLCQQTEVLVNELSEEGGAGAFINVRRDFLQ